MHQYLAPSVPEQPLYTYYRFLAPKKILIKKFILMPAKKTKSTYCVSLKLDNKAKAQHQLVGPA